MGKMGCGYGSEFHLLRYLGYHRHKLNSAVEAETGGRVLEWLDFGIASNEKHHYLDEEFKGVDFLKDDAVKTVWNAFWPQTGNVQNWDAVGKLQSESQVEYLLVEAKGHVEEVRSDCGAKEEGGLGQIRDAFAETIMAYQSEKTVDDWLSPYYQYANRLASLRFLLKNNVPARLVFIYFLGDQWPEGKDSRGRPVTCPKTRQKWESHLKEMYDHLGVKHESELEKRVHRLFLYVGGPD